jgi:hypothetical protein
VTAAIVLVANRVDERHSLSPEANSANDESKEQTFWTIGHLLFEDIGLEASE